MKNLSACIIILCSNYLFGQIIEGTQGSTPFVEKTIKQSDANKYFHVGVIPYQLLSRSSGAYVRYDFKRFSLEYRGTYTYETDYNSIGFSIGGYDNFLFRGINNSVIFYFPTKTKTKIGIMLLQKYWWYDNKWTDNNNDGFYHDAYVEERKSTIKFGIGTGIEISNDFSYRKADLGFFVNLSFTEFNVQSQVFQGGHNSFALTYPRHDSSNMSHLTLTFGFKFGYRKALK